MDSGVQKILFDRIHDEYERHYNYQASTEYRRRFAYDVVFAGLELNGLEIADLASGSGHNSLALLDRYPGARVIGYDISEKAFQAYRTLVGRDALQVDLTKPFADGARFDAAMIFGGLHHCLADLPATLSNIASMLKPDAWLLMAEPSREFALDVIRRIWYRLDREHFDAQTERALKHDDILRMAKGKFRLHDVAYLGGPAYFLILQSMQLRVPLKVKSSIAPFLFLVERAYSRLPGRFWFPYFVARWRGGK